MGRRPAPPTAPPARSAMPGRGRARAPRPAGSLAAPIIVAIGVVIGAIAFAVTTWFLDSADQATELRLSRQEAELALLREALAEARVERQGLRADLAQLRDDLSLVANRAPVAPPLQAAPPADLGGEDFESPPPTEALTEQMRLAKSRFNKGITQPRNATMLAILGPPRDSYNTDCQPVTNPRLRALIETRKVGPITVTMLKPALDSLARVLERLEQSDPDIHAKLGTAGGLCARLIRGSTRSISNHSWGTAIDLTLEGQLDPFADGATQFGLLILAEYFNEEGWFWGAAYNSREDSMHFEIGEETLRKWQTEGKL
ncbi:M15 family peptidase [Paracoccus versutus]|uniref:D-alanyl-D-alanine carboxypeptidase-like protein n=1 Tax=Paracoccus versutus TaxID=34007 RepID=A0AAQ0KME5_PARVE|nr:M15 family metallopeptidase [Paracoccus versutus]REG52461.1 D-alanyl-D-alanine carboxypeptidase-like protein [Paracoccus versutus]WEJ78724.1 M15 family peptidase [Paracoccus versutus]